MRNPPIIRAVVSDRFGEVLFDSAEPPRARPLLSAPPPPPPPPPRNVRGYIPKPPSPPAPVADLGDSSNIVGYLLLSIIVALLVAGVLVSVAIVLGAAA